MDEFTQWYEKQGGTVDTSSMGLVDIPGQGRGVIAVKDIPVCSPSTFLIS